MSSPSNFLPLGEEISRNPESLFCHTAFREIEALNKAVPSGSLKYTSPQHQRRLQALYAVAYGRDAIVGRHGRTA